MTNYNKLWVSGEMLYNRYVYNSDSLNTIVTPNKDFHYKI